MTSLFVCCSVGKMAFEACYLYVKFDGKSCLGRLQASFGYRIAILMWIGDIYVGWLFGIKTHVHPHDEETLPSTRKILLTRPFSLQYRPRLVFQYVFAKCPIPHPRIQCCRRSWGESKMSTQTSKSICFGFEPLGWETLSKIREDLDLHFLSRMNVPPNVRILCGENGRSFDGRSFVSS